MNEPESFYVGYLPCAPAEAARFTRRVVGLVVIAALAVAAVMAIVLPPIGAGEFEFGHPRELGGTMRGDAAMLRLSTDQTDLLLVGFGKHGVPPEICGVQGRDVTVRGTLIRRDGRQLFEVDRLVETRAQGASEAMPVSLGRFTLRGEIVDSKCFFGVMNPGEGRVHRACAELCLRGGVPAVLVVRDRAGNVAHLVIARRDGRSLQHELLPWVGQSVEMTGEVSRRGRWLAIEPDASVLRASP